MTMLHPKRFLGDLKLPTYQRDFTDRVRLGVINSVNAVEGTCRIAWMDKPGFKEDVLLMQANDGDWHIPRRGAVAVVFFDRVEQARIVRYVNLGHKSKVSQVQLPTLKEGEKLWEVGGSYIYMRQNGDIQFFTALGVEISLENAAGTYRSQSVNWKVITNAGNDFFGVVKRLTLNADGSSSVKVVSDVLRRPYTEKRTQVFEHPKDATTFLTQTPLLDIIFGTVIDDDGNIVDRTDTPTVLPTQEVAALLEFSSGVKITIAKNGVLTILNAKINLNEGSVDATDVDDVHAINDPARGTRGQHVAREHDTVHIPITSTYSDTEHLGLTEKAAANLAALQLLASAIVSPTGPCFLNPALLASGNTKLAGEIVEGATNVYTGDE